MVSQMDDEGGIQAHIDEQQVHLLSEEGISAGAPSGREPASTRLG